MTLAETDYLDKLDDDFFSVLIKQNFRCIDQHCKWMQIETGRSFCLAAITSAAATIFISIGVGLLILKSAIVASIIVLSTGIVVALLSALFFYWHGQIVLKAANYYQKLALMQNVNLALKTAAQLQDTDKAFAQKDVVKELLHDINKLLVTGN